ncbi:hypothetical protein [Kineosporia sp. NBRC 101731]|uniref:hypothetical protein n=1 Tax=Kineosporia sp. NBRC 101731 TaxID=3032199 RepID=UPI00255766DC|nr:hypothetical protein [Kineosporia sp. NBRC 101731]
MTIGPIGDLGETATAISQQAQFLAQQNELRTQNAREATDRQAQLTGQSIQGQQAQQAILDRQDERQAQLQAQLEAQNRADDRRAALEAIGVQRAQLQDQLLAEQDLQATTEVINDQNAIDQQRSFDQAAVSTFLNPSTTVNSVEEAIDEFQQLGDTTGLQVSQVQVTLTRTGSEIDTQL